MKRRKLLCAAAVIIFSVFIFAYIVIAGNDIVIKSCATGEKKIALTFDDGPHPRYTGEILDILGEYDIKATFFVIGENVELYPDLIEREIAEGHEIGNHTESHKSLLKADRAEISREVGVLGDSLREKFGYAASLLRPPGGQYTEALAEYAKENSQKIILWSVDTRDWAHTSVSGIRENVMKNTSDGSIILFHDYVAGKSPTPEALRSVIPELLAKGYKFVTVSELIR